jgi:sugar (pentulose or hexulose) kinase
VEYAIAVVDIGMTNKKIALYDDKLTQHEAWYNNFPPRMIPSPGGGSLPAHDLEAMEDWFTRILREGAKKYPLRAIAVTTHGATFVCVGEDGKPSLPCIYYTHEPGEDFHRRFYERFGAPEVLQERTGTPYLKGMINTAKGIFFAREVFPEALNRSVHLLQYPQYWGYRFTGKTGAEGTYMGCHSYLWDHPGRCLSPVAESLGVSAIMPRQIGNSWDALGTINRDFAAKTGLKEDTLVTMGIHDSNASLLPHFAKKGEGGFVLNSTGTWCVIMNPVLRYGFAPEELGKVVFFNISAFGRPVKTAIFLGGQEFETWSERIMAIHGRKDIPGYDGELYRSLLRERDTFLLPELVAGSGQFPRSRPRIVEKGREYPYGALSGEGIPPCLRDYEKAFALLRISLVMQTLTALERTGLAPGKEVFTEGGFRKDEAYHQLLAAALKDNRVFLTDIAEASALGAAMTAKMALTGRRLTELSGDFETDYHEVTKGEIPELFAYRESWLSYTYN